MNALNFAWSQGVKNTMLEKAERKINTIEGKAKCLDCDAEFNVVNYFDACPICGEHFINIIQGKELRVKSLVIS